MAVRDRNMFVWQAYVIASSIISVILLVGIFFLWRAWSDKSRQFESKSQELVTAQDTFRTTKEKLDRLMSMMGKGQWTQADLESMHQKFVNDAELGPIEQEFERVQALFPANTPLSDKNLIRAPQLLLDTIRIRNEEVTEARNRTNQLQAQKEEDHKNYQKSLEQATVAQQKAEKDLADTRNAHKAQIEMLNKEKAENLAKFDQFKNHFDSQLKELSGTNEKLVSDNRLHMETIARQLERIQQFDTPDYAAAQGQVTHVADGGSVAWINLGSSHGLKKGVQFSILDAGEVEITNAVPKAKMIIQEVSETSARGQVFFGGDAIERSRYYANVVKTGDLIYSPVWRPGRRVSFALVGKMDINGDLVDDIEQVKQMIVAAGGVIDAELPSKGAEKGQVTHNTSYLVLGSDIESAAENPISADKAKEYARFIAKASGTGVIQRISVDKLMGYLKVDESSRVVGLGNRTQASDFKVRNQITPQSTSGNVSEIFRQKSPPK